MRRHAFDATAFVWGLLLLGASAVFLLDEYGTVNADAKWLFPAALIAAGIVGVTNALRSIRH